jgi:hypothetical protein
MFGGIIRHIGLTSPTPVLFLSFQQRLLIFHAEPFSCSFSYSFFHSLNKNPTSSMHSLSISAVALLALLAGSALAETSMVGMTKVSKRQSQAFQPPTDSVTSCASDELQCGAPPATPTCYTPSLGDVCCSGGCKKHSSLFIYDE